MKRLLLTASLLIAAFVLLSACSRQKKEEVEKGAKVGKKGGILLLAIGEDPDSLDPHKTIMATADYVMSSLYQSLVYIDSDRQPKGWVAESWTISDDQRVVTFNIRKGIKFHDGTTLDAHAVEFTFGRMLDPTTAAPARDQMGPLKEVTALDDYTVEFVFEEPYAPFWTNSFGSYAGIISPAAVEKYGKDFGRHPVGSGPFMFEEWIPGSEIRMVRNPDYKQFRNDINNKGPAYLDGITFRVVPEVGTRIAALETGELHLMILQREATPRFLDDPEFKVDMFKNATDFVFIEFNYKSAPFDNPAFRRALGYAIDKKAIADAAWGGFATVNLNPLPLGLPGWDPAIGEKYGMPYNPKKAKKELAALGWVDSDDDGIIDKDGKPAKFTVWTYSGFETVKRGAEIIQANLNAVGMDISVKLTDFGTMAAEMPKAQFDFDLMRWTWPDPVILSLLFKTPGWKDLHSDPTLDEMLIAAEQEMDAKARVEEIKKIQQYVLENAIVIPILTDWFISGMRKEVQGYHRNVLGFEGNTRADIWLEKE